MLAEIRSGDFSTDQVIAQEPPAGTPLPRGSAVRLTLSFEPPVTDVSLGPLPLALPAEAPEP